MIIKRKYETYYELANRDEEAKKIIFKYLNRLPKDVTKEEAINDNLYDILIYQSDLGCGIGDFKSFCEELDRLDTEKPYENGLTYRDVTKIITLPSRTGSACTFVMVSEKAEMPKRIVQIMATEVENGKTKIIKPWMEGILLF